MNLIIEINNLVQLLVSIISLFWFLIIHKDNNENEIIDFSIDLLTNFF